MSVNIEQYVEVVNRNGLNTAKAVDFSAAPTVALPAGTTIAGTTAAGTSTITSTSATALTVGANGATNPVLKIDASASSVATGISVTGAAAASGVAVATISSGTNEALTIDAKGSGLLTLNGIATGNVVIGHGLTGSIQSLSGAGAVNLTTLITAITSTGANALTLANGVSGQIKILFMVVDGGDATLTPTSKTGYTTIVFNDASDSCMLVYSSTLGWSVLSNNGCTIA
jgi:hypothetical protein